MRTAKRRLSLLVSLAAFLSACDFDQALRDCQSGLHCKGPSLFTISGTITGAVNAGVTVSLEEAPPDAAHLATVDAFDTYAFAQVGPGRYTVTPAAAGFTFAPPRRSVIVDSADITDADFAGASSLVTYTLARSSGDAQSGVAGSALAAPLVVAVTDADGHAVAGATVMWATTSGGLVSPGTAATDASGRASATATLGPTAGANAFEARVDGAEGSPVTFLATGTAGAATTIALWSGNNQIAAPGALLPEPLVVQVTDANGNGTTGVTVDWAAADGGLVSAAITTTDTVGRASVTATLGAGKSPSTFQARVGGLAGSPVVFTATGTAGPATTLTLIDGNNQLGFSGVDLLEPLVVRVTAPNGTPVANAIVSWAATSGGGRVSSPSTSTNSDGRASVVATPGPCDWFDVCANNFTATATGMTGSPVVFVATCSGGG